MNPVARIIGMWPSAEHFASDIGLKYPSYGRVLKMRGRIPARYWPAVLVAAELRGLRVCREDLIEAHAKPAPVMDGAMAS